MLNKIHCPHCNLRLFDTTDDNKGRIEIKCARCRKIVKIELNDAIIERDFAEIIRQMDSVAV